MSECKVGDKVLVEAEIIEINENSSGRYKVASASFEYNPSSTLMPRHIYVDEVYPIFSKTYEDGLREAWELARRIICNTESGGLHTSELEQIFGYAEFDDVLKNCTPQEAAATIAEWEEKEIHVNDEVRFEGNIGVVYDIKGGKMCEIMGRNADLYVRRKEDLTKTGRTIDIAGLLTQIGGTEDA